MPVEFQRERCTARFRSPDGREEVERRLEVRFDPLLGASSRIVEGMRLPTADAEALVPIQQPDPSCPFCPDRIERVTPLIPLDVSEEGRIRVGESTLFPNLVPYARYAAVAVLTPRHWLSPADFTPRILADNLHAALRYIRGVYRFDASARFCAYNINYLYPSGGSLPHPHAQVYLDPHPTTMLRLQQEAGDRYRAAHGRSFWEDLVVAEEEHGVRFVGRTGAVSWMTAFAPIGFNEVRAIVAERETILDLTEEDVESLALGISRVLTWYDACGYNSFNLALYSGDLEGRRGFRVNMAVITRTALLPYYRSDAMYLERLHWEAAVDRLPEDVAEGLRPLFTIPPGREAGRHDPPRR